MDVEEIEQVIQVRGAVHQIGVLADLLEAFLGDLVMLVPDFAHQLLQYVLQGDDPLCAAKFIHNHRHVQLVLL